MESSCKGVKAIARLEEERVLLVHPGIYDEFKDRSYPPWGVLCVGAACRALGAEVVVVDLCGEALKDKLERLVEETRPTVIGMTAKLGNGARRMRRAVDFLRGTYDIPIGVGGPLVSLYPDPSNALWAGIEALFWGDGEDSFPTWVASGCPEAGVIGPSEVQDLDGIGLPMWWDGLADYISDGDWWPGLKVRSVHVSAARGCSRRCTFCYLNRQHVGRRFRVVSPSRLLAGCEEALAKWGVRGFYFVDDCFLMPGMPGTESLISLLGERGAPYRFGCDLQLHELEDRAFLSRIYAAGFRSLYVGVECASRRIRRRLGKGRTTVPVRETLRGTIDMGFVVRASIGMGWPDETEAEIEDTLRLIEALPDLMLDAFRYTPLPGVPLTRYFERTMESADTNEQPISPFVDYSEFSENYSSLPDATMEVLWSRMLALEQERHERYFARRAVPRC